MSINRNKQKNKTKTKNTWLPHQWNLSYPNELIF